MNRLPLLLLCAGCPAGGSGGSISVTLESPDALYIGEWQYLSVSLTNVSLDDLTFTVDEGEPAGKVSLSRDETFDAANPTIMLLAGTAPGEDYTLRAWHEGIEVGSTLFTVTDAWDYTERRGPPLWLEDLAGDSSAASGGAWGSPSASTQNAGTIDIPAERNPWKAAIVLLEFTDRTFSDPKNEPAFWLGRMSTDADSTSQYFLDMSDGVFSINADAYGPYTAPLSWGDYHDGKAPYGTFYQACSDAADSDVNLKDYNSLVCVAASDLKQPEAFTWPYGGNRNLKTNDGDVTIRTISMPEDWTTLDASNRDSSATLAHEMGHNLGLPDLYKPNVPASGPDTGQQNLANWDVMNTERQLPYMSIGNRLQLGFIDSDDVISLNPSLDLDADGQINTLIRLNPINQITPDVDHAVGVEFRLSDGWNYYLEYRAGIAGEMGDQGPTVPCCGGPGVLLVTDVLPGQARETGPSPRARPDIIQVTSPMDAIGDVYTQTELSTGNQLRIEITDIDPASNDMEVWVRYGSESSGIWDGASPASDPAITPWPASEERRWQSPDITLSNTLSDSDPTLSNVAIADLPNTISATVRNDGAIDAVGVTVNFYAKDFNIGEDVEATFLGSDTQDIPAGGAVTFAYEGWQPGEGGHHCVVAAVEDYDEEMSTANNVAQSNYDVIYSASASPAARIRRTLTVHNPYDEETWFQLNASQRGENFRVYLETTELILEPGEEKAVVVMFEYTQESKEMRQEYARVQIDGWMVDPRVQSELGYTEDAADLVGGVDVLMLNGWKTLLDDTTIRKSDTGFTASGAVTRADNNELVSEGMVVAVGRYDSATDPTFRSTSVDVDVDGSFFIELESGDLIDVQVYYLPGESVTPYAMASSGWLKP